MKNNFPMDDLVGVQEKIELKFLESHTHFLTGDIDDESIKKAIQWIIYENMSPPKEKRLTMYVNSCGGDLYQAFGLIDVMKKSQYPISTIGIGSIMSAGFLIFASGTKNYRFIAENTGIMCHQFSNEQEGKYHDIKAQIKENDSCNQRMLNILRDASGLPERTIKAKLLGPTDAWLTAEELVELKIADRIF
jgi:ATP-dependent Clp protease protease subunit